METLEFIIYPDGRVQEKVTGVIGASCAEVTAAIEAQLGAVTHTQATSEYFAQLQPCQTELSRTVATTVATSQW